MTGYAARAGEKNKWVFECEGFAGSEEITVLNNAMHMHEHDARCTMPTHPSGVKRVGKE